MLSKILAGRSFRRKPESSDVKMCNKTNSRWIPGQARNDGQRFAFFSLIEMLSKKFILDRYVRKCVLIAFALFLSAVFSAAEAGERYIGAGKCGLCHKKIYEEWKSSGHSRILHKPFDSEVKELPLPEGYSRKNLSFIVGGYKWKVLFLDTDGYLVNRQYNLQSRRWVAYFPGERTPYDCGGCHTTGFDPKGSQKGFTGIKGAWKFPGVQCEACHGPGAAHAASTLKSEIIIDRDCSRCHGTEPYDVIPVTGVFISPYTEANQLQKSKMRGLGCTGCHDPHKSAQSSIKNACEACHREIEEKYKDSYLYETGVSCTDCHMPPAIALAEGKTDSFKGDFKSHLFRIDHTKKAPFIEKDGVKINPGYLSVDYACMPCHRVYRDREWARSFGLVAHGIKITPNIKIMRLQMVLASAGFAFAVLSMLSAMSLKGWLWPVQNKKKMLSIHRHSVWITFAVYFFVSVMCVTFHFPVSEPAKAVNLGWFLIHPINGAIGFFVYAGKVVSVRKLKKGWGMPGVLWGAGLFLIWLIQFATATLDYFKLIK